VKASDLKIIAFEVTRKCRFNCIHCRADAADDISAQLSTDQCRQVLEAIADYARCTIILTGGEPLERPDIYEIASYGTSLGHRVVLATCGYLVNEDVAKRLKDSGVMAISFSLDGATSKTHDAFRQSEGAFDAIIAASKIVRDACIRFQINTTITKQNIGEIDAIANLAQQLGAYCFNPFILVPTGRGEHIASQLLSADEYNKVLKHLLELKNKMPIELRVTCGPQFARIAHGNQRDAGGQHGVPPKGCLGARQFGFVSYKGDVQMCGFLPIAAGNLVANNYNFADIWENACLFKDIRNLKAYKDSCGQCEYVGLCGGCRARAYGITGDYMAADPICDYEPKKAKAK
jgi:radical SAM protein with 4Fe4S-binding SPASM domain